ncbi:hypothetical protein Enr13x_17800 [Stieleria neptunia]|uniref:Uncharacterized protein n=1 Tax=Stieleria neptunia TaxID=2527979 RepID=A0A518HME0_9BACT|nr:hypothetical protein Enr13x_17800 [Stieleria neptunia]
MPGRLRVAAHSLNGLPACALPLKPPKAQGKTLHCVPVRGRGAGSESWSGGGAALTSGYSLKSPGDVNCISDGFDRSGRRQDFCSANPLWRLLAAQTPSLPAGERRNGLPKAAAKESTSIGIRSTLGLRRLRRGACPLGDSPFLRIRGLIAICSAPVVCRFRIVAVHD